MKSLPMVLRLISGSETPSSAPMKRSCAWNVDERDVVMVAEQRDDLAGLVRPHQAVVDEHAGQLLADGLVNEHGRHRGIDVARQAADHAAFADLRADALDRLLPEGLHGPIARAAGDLAHEVADEELT